MFHIWALVNRVATFQSCKIQSVNITNHWAVFFWSAFKHSNLLLQLDCWITFNCLIDTLNNTPAPTQPLVLFYTGLFSAWMQLRSCCMLLNDKKKSKIEKSNIFIRTGMKYIHEVNETGVPVWFSSTCTVSEFAVYSPRSRKVWAACRPSQPCGRMRVWIGL